MELAIDKFNIDRLGCITGSECSVMFPDKGDGKVGQTTYAKKLAMNRYFNFYDEVSNWQLQHGEMGEVFAHQHYLKYFDSEAQNGFFKRIDEWAGTCDAISEKLGLDYKCPTSLHKWLEYLDGVSKQQYYQGQLYCVIFDKPKWRFCAYLMETEFMNNNGLTYPVAENKRMITIDVELDPTFKAKLEMNSPFVIKTRDAFIEKLKLQFDN